MFHFEQPKSPQAPVAPAAKPEAGSFDPEISMFVAEAGDMMKSALRLLDSAALAPDDPTEDAATARKLEEARRRFNTVWTG